MLSRKEMKKKAKHSLKKHYVVFVMITLIGAFIGSEYASSMDFVSLTIGEEASENVVESGTTTTAAGLDSIITDVVNGDLTDGKQQSDAIISQEQTTSEGRALGHTRGVLAGFVNSITSGAIIFTFISAIQSFGASENIAIFAFIFVALALVFAVWFFLFLPYKTISKRFFLEGRTYERVPLQRFVFFLRIKRWTRACCTLFLTFIFNMLWYLTFIGGIIKRYSYYMVPFIVAENPDIRPREAITLSRKMMNGHKWQLFKLELSFIGWQILTMCSFGLVGILYSNPYKQATDTEFYVELRRLAKEGNIPGAELLNDTYLYEPASKEQIAEAYDDIMHLIDEGEVELATRGGIRGFLANVFGITLSYDKNELAYQESMERKARYEALKHVISGEMYPNRLYTIKEEEKRERMKHLYYMRHYSIWSLILMFFVFAFIGWVWEVSLHLISDGVFVNRGVLHGPWLPIYGTGGIVILVLLNKFRSKPAVEFLTTVVVCGCVEYFTSWYLEVAHNGQKWWDYSGYFLNLNGRICAEGLLVFGLGGMAIVYVAAPLLDNHLKRIPMKVLVPLCVALVITFGVDQSYSSKHPNTGAGITDYESSANYILPEETTTKKKRNHA